MRGGIHPISTFFLLSYYRFEPARIRTLFQRSKALSHVSILPV